MRSKIVTKFLWWPLTLNGVRKWFVYATIQYEDHGEYEYYERDSVYRERWVPIRFLR